MTPTSIKPTVAKYLGIPDIALDDQYESGYLNCVKTANQYVANKLFVPLVVTPATVGAPPVGYPAPEIDPDAVASVGMVHPVYGTYPLVRFTVDEAVRRFGSLAPAPGKPQVFVPTIQNILVLPVPAQGGNAVYSIAHVTNVRDVAADQELLGGQAKPYHDLIAIYAAVCLLRSDGNEANQSKIAELMQQFAVDRAEAVRVLHRNSYISDLLGNLMPEGVAKK